MDCSLIGNASEISKNIFTVVEAVLFELVQVKQSTE
jgi:hypothetical protein